MHAPQQQNCSQCTRSILPQHTRSEVQTLLFLERAVDIDTRGWEGFATTTDTKESRLQLKHAIPWGFCAVQNDTPPTLEHVCVFASPFLTHHVLFDHRRVGSSSSFELVDLGSNCLDLTLDLLQGRHMYLRRAGKPQRCKQSLVYATHQHTQ